MNTARKSASLWLQDHRWIAATVVLASAIAYLTATDLTIRAASAYDAFRLWQGRQRKIAEVTTWRQDKARIGNQRRLLQARFDSLYVSLPHRDEMSGILQLLHDNARKAGARLQEVRPGERVSFPKYDELPLTLAVVGSYHSFNDMIDRIERSLFLMKVIRFDVQRLRSGSSDLKLDLDLHVIVLKEAAPSS